MSLVRLYLYREKVIVPTTKQTDAGFYIDCPPVIVHSIHDLLSLRPQLVHVLAAGNEVVPTPAGSQEAGSVILDKLSLQKWSSFEKSAVMYTILFGIRYTTIYASGRGIDGMWSESQSKQRLFHPSLSIVELANLIIEDMESQPEARSERFSLTLVPKDLV
jgi:hypothetical protein